MEIKVNASKNYSVVIEKSLSKLNNYLSITKGDKVAIITDSNVEKLYGNVLDNYISTKTIFHYTLPSGEENKSENKYFEILNFLAENNFKRNDTIIAFGGGVTGDLSGFVASTYMRGITFINIPTTLLSMVDSSVGGKTAINLKSGKNLVGTFYQPALVYICLDFLKTLSEREILSGMGEVFKYVFILGLINKQDVISGIDENLIYKCIKIKQQIVENDERESGERKLLNFGHTIGHAIEKASNYSLSHGECVLKGINLAIEFSYKKGFLSTEKYNEAKEIIKLSKADLSNPFSREDLIKYLKNDKKGDGEYVDFIVIDNTLLSKIEKVKLQELYSII